MSTRTRQATAEQQERRLLDLGLLCPSRLCEVVDVLPGMAADGRALTVVDWDAGGTPVRVHTASTYTPAKGDLALVVSVERTPIALCAVVAPPPEE